VKKEIAFFDFDGTITTKDTLLEFIKFTSGHYRFYLGFLVNLPYLIGYKIKLISNHSAKERILRFFFKDTPLEVFTEYCRIFSNNILPQLIRPKAIEEIESLKRRSVTIVVVSASPENWIEEWATKYKLELLASKMEVKNKKLTGKLLGKNCHGPEKVNRICESYNLSNYTIVAAYGDTHGDKPMLQLAKNSFYKPFV
jgi:phosphatidylglycerophosphatase C